MSEEPEPSEATELLRAAAGGDPSERQRLFELLHGELHEQAARAMRRERDDHTLQPTALVHEVWLKLFAGDDASFQDRQHFQRVSARVMRQVLVDHARGRRRLKRGGRRERVELEVAEADSTEAGPDALDVIALADALDELQELAPRQAEVVELRFFGGLSVEETAAALELSERTVAREWRFARAWLASRIGPA